MSRKFQWFLEAISWIAIHRNLIINSSLKIHQLKPPAWTPNKRKLPEVVYEAIESSGWTLEQVGREMTGCFAASFSQDFQ